MYQGKDKKKKDKNKMHLRNLTNNKNLEITLKKMMIKITKK